MKKNQISYYFSVTNGRILIQKYRSKSLRRFRIHIRTIKWQKQDFKVYLKVNYGAGGYNDGFYYSAEDFVFALDAFADPSISNYLYE